MSAANRAGKCGRMSGVDRMGQVLQYVGNSRAKNRPRVTRCIERGQIRARSVGAVRGHSRGQLRRTIRTTRRRSITLSF